MMQSPNSCALRPRRPTVMVVYPLTEVGEFIRDGLISIGCNVIVAQTHAAALAALALHPDIVILDVVMSQIDFGFERRRLKAYVQDGLLCDDDYWQGILRLKQAINAEEQQRSGLMLAEAIRTEIPSMPVIFVSIDPTQLQSLPFGETVCLGSECITLFDVVERMIDDESLIQQRAYGETTIVLELPQKLGVQVMPIRIT